MQQWQTLQKASMLPILNETIELIKDIYIKTMSRQDDSSPRVA
jgi:hypothetical protein